MFRGRKVLVTGANGMIGRELVKLLEVEGAQLFLSDLRFGEDLRDISTCKRICEGMDYVFNLVGIKCSPRFCDTNPADIIGPMLQFNTNMCEAAMEVGVKWYLYTSSVGVYQPAEILREDDVWNTQPSPYDWFGGWAKRMGELQLLAYKKQYGANFSIVRPANVYGPNDNFDLKSAMVIPSLIRKAAENDVLEIWGDGSEIRDFIHARDVARGMIHMVKNKVSEPVNLGSGEGISIKTIAEIIAKKFGREINWLTTEGKGDAKRILDTTRAKSVGFSPLISIEEGIEETIDWFIS